MEAIVTLSQPFSTGRSAERPAYTPAEKALVRRLVDLFDGKASGNMGPELYQNGGADLFEKLRRHIENAPFKQKITNFLRRF